MNAEDDECTCERCASCIEDKLMIEVSESSPLSAVSYSPRSIDLATGLAELLFDNDLGVIAILKEMR